MMFAVVDLPDGSFILSPKPRAVRAQRLALVVAGVLLVGLSVWFISITINNPTFDWPGRLLFPGVFVVAWIAAWFVLRPPRLRATATELTSDDLWNQQRVVARSELAFIFRGQIFLRGQYAGSWFKRYLFADNDGNVRTSCSPTWFADQDMTEFARRLTVPIRGDFSLRVKDRIDSTTA